MHQTYTQYPRKYCPQSRHGGGLGGRPRSPRSPAGLSDALRPRTQRTSCGRERGRESHELKTGQQSSYCSMFYECSMTHEIKM